MPPTQFPTYHFPFPKANENSATERACVAESGVSFRRVTPATTDPSTGADALTTMLVDADDYAGGSSHMVAYTTNGETATDPSSMHFSKTDQRNAYNYPALSAITCGAGGTDSGTVGTVVSDKMLSLGGYVLVHELTWVKSSFPHWADDFGSRAFFKAHMRSLRTSPSS